MMNRITEPAFFVLATLADGARHGYGIVGEVADLSDRRVSLKIGTLYGVLDRLVADGLVEPDRDEVWQGRLRRYYRITESGRACLTHEAERHAAKALLAERRLGVIRPASGEAAR
ncbi:MAG TPA: PadR family transcriptional regulator [Micromonosporaceae bacterium]|nr:PadR family transcriptional regulator [Micromonosporaceae bacterium]